MNKQQRTVQVAVMCLQELDAQAGKALSSREISQRRGISLSECTSILQRLSRAGIVELATTGLAVLRRPVEELTALDILQAVWNQTKKQSTFEMMVGHSQAVETTLAFVSRQDSDAAING